MWPPLLVFCLLPVVQKYVFEQVAGVQLCHEGVHFVILGDCDPVVLTFDLAAVQLVVEGFDVGVGRVTPRIE